MAQQQVIIQDTDQLQVFAQAGSVTVTNNSPTVAVNVLSLGDDAGVSGTIAANGGQQTFTVAQAQLAILQIPAPTPGGVAVSFSGPDYPLF